MFVSNSQHNSSPRLLLVKTNTVVFFCLFSFLSPTSLSLDTLPFTWNDKWDLGPARVTIVRYVFRALINVHGRTGELVHMVRQQFQAQGPPFSSSLISHPTHQTHTYAPRARTHTHTHRYWRSLFHFSYYFPPSDFQLYVWCLNLSHIYKSRRYLTFSLIFWFLDKGKRERPAI